MSSTEPKQEEEGDDIQVKLDDADGMAPPVDPAPSLLYFRWPIARLGVTNKPHLFELRATLRRTTREAQVEDKKNSRHEENVKMKKEGSMASDEETVEDDAADIASVIPSPSGVDDSNRMSLVFSVAAKYSLKKPEKRSMEQSQTSHIFVQARRLATYLHTIGETNIDGTPVVTMAPAAVGGGSKSADRLTPRYIHIGSEEIQQRLPNLIPIFEDETLEMMHRKMWIGIEAIDATSQIASRGDIWMCTTQGNSISSQMYAHFQHDRVYALRLPPPSPFYTLSDLCLRCRSYRFELVHEFELHATIESAESEVFPGPPTPTTPPPPPMTMTTLEAPIVAANVIGVHSPPLIRRRALKRTRPKESPMPSVIVTRSATRVDERAAMIADAAITVIAAAAVLSSSPPPPALANDASSLDATPLNRSHDRSINSSSSDRLSSSSSSSISRLFQDESDLSIDSMPDLSMSMLSTPTKRTFIGSIASPSSLSSSSSMGIPFGSNLFLRDLTPSHGSPVLTPLQTTRDQHHTQHQIQHGHIPISLVTPTAAHHSAVTSSNTSSDTGGEGGLLDTSHSLNDTSISYASALSYGMLMSRAPSQTHSPSDPLHGHSRSRHYVSNHLLQDHHSSDDPDEIMLDPLPPPPLPPPPAAAASSSASSPSLLIHPMLRTPLEPLSSRPSSSASWIKRPPTRPRDEGRNNTNDYMTPRKKTIAQPPFTGDTHKPEDRTK